MVVESGGLHIFSGPTGRVLPVSLPECNTQHPICHTRLDRVSRTDARSQSGMTSREGRVVTERDRSGMTGEDRSGMRGGKEKGVHF